MILLSCITLLLLSCFLLVDDRINGTFVLKFIRYFKKLILQQLNDIRVLIC